MPPPQHANRRKLLADELTDREFAVFYDKNDQSRILAKDVEEYLAPIYSSEASFVLCLLGTEYPNRIWTKFESDKFSARFGSESVIPIWFRGEGPSAFDQTKSIGGHFLDRQGDLENQIHKLGQILQQKLQEHRLLTKLDVHEFMCRLCRRIYPLPELATGESSVCIDCSEKQNKTISRRT